MLHFQDPLKLKTKRAVFEDIFIASDPGTLEELKELSSTRILIEESINDRTIITKAVAREMSGGSTLQREQDTQKLEKYLPLLENLIHHVKISSNKPRLLDWTSNLKIRWSSALILSSFFNCKAEKFFQIDNLLFELNMMRFLYGALLQEWAHEVLSKDLVQSATLFRKAAGVYQSLVFEVLPELQPIPPSERPPEATLNMSSVMSLICLAEAQAVTIRKAEEKGNSGSLLAKLHYGVVQMLEEATAILHPANKDNKEISTRVLEYISSCKVLHELKSYTYLAESLKTESRIGVALGVLRHIQTNLKKNKLPDKEPSWRLVLNQEIDNVNELIRKYERENNFVWNQKIPVTHELPLPEGKKIVNSIPYQPQRSEQKLSFKL